MALDLSSLMSSPAGGGAAGAAGAVGGLAAATPYGAAISAAAGLAGKAFEDTPSNTTSGSGSYQSGPFVIGAKQVGGKGNSGGQTTATASQTPTTANGAVEQSASSISQAATAKSQMTLYVIIIAAVALILGGMFAFSRRK